VTESIDALGAYRSREACADANLIPAILSPQPIEDLFLAGHCAVCKRDTRFRLGREMYMERWGYNFREALTCDHCEFNARMRAALQYVDQLRLPADATVYATERVTPVFSFLSKRFPSIVGSEFLPDVQLGGSKNGIRCEDLQALTFEAESFDLVVSLDVLEHVPDPKAALGEMRRVLRPQGTLVLTCPFTMQLQATYKMARLNEQGEIEHLIAEPQYHGNPLGPPSLCYNTFGWDLLDDMRAAGFADAAIIPYRNAALGYVGGPFPLMVGAA
jgi:SAM-dependent methyltransferase